VQLRAEQMDPEVPVHGDPQEPLADADEGGRLRNRVGGEVVKLHPVVVAQPAHEAARQRGEALVVPDEADDVAVRRVGLSIYRRWNEPRRGRPLHVWRQLTAVHELVQGELRHRRSIPWQQIQHHDWLGRSHCGWRWRAKTKRAAGESKGAHSREVKVIRKGQRVLSDEVRDFPLPLLRFIDLREPRSPNRARLAH
jgi:hypothetical protein